MPQILLEPAARVLLNDDIAGVRSDQIAGVRRGRELRQEIPDVVKTVDRNLVVLRLLSEQLHSLPPEAQSIVGFVTTPVQLRDSLHGNVIVNHYAPGPGSRTHRETPPTAIWSKHSPEMHPTTMSSALESALRMRTQYAVSTAAPQLPAFKPSLIGYYRKDAHLRLPDLRVPLGEDVVDGTALGARFSAAPSGGQRDCRRTLFGCWRRSRFWEPRGNTSRFFS